MEMSKRSTMQKVAKTFAPMDSLNYTSRFWPMNRRTGGLNPFHGEFNQCDSALTQRQAHHEAVVDRQNRKTMQNPNSKAIIDD